MYLHRIYTKIVEKVENYNFLSQKLPPKMNFPKIEYMYFYKSCKKNYLLK